MSFSYDPSGDLTDVTDVGGADTHFTYVAGHLLKSIRKPDQDPATGGDGHSTVMTYDTSGRVTKQVDAMGRVTKFAYKGSPSTSSGGTTSVTAPSGSVTVDAYVNAAARGDHEGRGNPLRGDVDLLVRPVDARPHRGDRPQRSHDELRVRPAGRPRVLGRCSGSRRLEHVRLAR